MPKTDIEGSNLFLQEAKGRKDVETSPKAIKAKAKAPPNLAIYNGDELHPVAAHVLKLAKTALSYYQTQRSPMKEKWDKADEFYWMAQKEYRKTELTRSIVSASVFHRVVRRLADGAYLASYNEDMPVKFFPRSDVFDASENKRRSALVANALNDWGAYCMQRTNLKEKAKVSYHKVYKQANHIVYTPYDFEIETRKRWENYDPNQAGADENGLPSFTHAETGAVSDIPHPIEVREVEYEYICKDEVGFHPRNLDSCFLDNRIDDLDRQTTFLEHSDITRPELWSQAKAGKFQNIDRITELHKFQQYSWPNEVENQRIVDSGKTNTDSSASEMYEHWKVWMLIPKLKVKFNKQGEPTDMEWDQNGESRRYLMHVIGDLSGSSVVVRFSESPYWGNGIPYIAAHSHTDDSGFYRRGMVELLEGNMIQEQTAKGQLMDNRTLLTFRPLKRIVGRVKNKDMRITHNTVFDVTSQDALQQLDVTDISGTIHNSLEYIKSDSEGLAQTPGYFLGENQGARTSATEFSAIRDQSSAPALNDIKSLNLQIAGGYMRKVKEYAPQFLEKDIAQKIMGDNGDEAMVMITADEFNADMMLSDVAVQDFENKATMRQILVNLMNVLLNPMLAPFINVTGLLVRLFKSFNTVFPNPEELLNKDPQVMALLQQYIAQRPSQNDAGAAQAGLPPPAAPGMPPGQPMAGNTEAQPLAGVGGQSMGA